MWISLLVYSHWKHAVAASDLAGRTTCQFHSVSCGPLGQQLRAALRHLDWGKHLTCRKPQKSWSTYANINCLPSCHGCSPMQNCRTDHGKFMELGWQRVAPGIINGITWCGGTPYNINVWYMYVMNDGFAPLWILWRVKHVWRRGKEKCLQYLLWKQDSKHRSCRTHSWAVLDCSCPQYSTVLGKKTIFPTDESFMSIMMNIEDCGWSWNHEGT